MSNKRKAKKILECEMIAGWNCNSERRITEIEIFSSKDVKDDIEARYDNWEGSWSKSWGNGDFRSSAVGLFTYIASEYGFHSRDIAYEALKQFSRVKGQKWSKATRDWMDGKLL